jgi:hypothetical protein
VTQNKITALGFIVAMCLLDASCGGDQSNADGARDAPVGRDMIAGDASVADSGDTSVADSGDTSVADSGDVAVADRGDAAVADRGDTAVADRGDATAADSTMPQHGCKPGVATPECGGVGTTCTSMHSCCLGVGSDCGIAGIHPDAGVVESHTPCATDEMCAASEYCQTATRCCPVGYTCDLSSTGSDAATGGDTSGG